MIQNLVLNGFGAYAYFVVLWRLEYFMDFFSYITRGAVFFGRLATFTLLVELISESRRANPGPAYYLSPFGAKYTIGEWRCRVNGVGTFELFVCRKSLMNYVCVEPKQNKNKNTGT